MIVAPGLPPAIVVGIETPIGLTVLRELGRHRVPVIGVAASRHSAGLYSRYLWRGLVRATEPGGLLQQLQALAAQHAGSPLFAIGESDILSLNRHREALAPLRPMFPPAECMRLVLDKEITHSIAREVGIRVPGVTHGVTLADIAAQRDSIDFPVVLKWPDPHRVFPALQRMGLPLDKFRYCADWAELEAYLGSLEGVGELPMIQQYCPGHGLGQSLFMHEGRALLAFQHRRVNEWPPEGGVSSQCVSLDPGAHAQLLEQSVELLRRIQWQGPAMVEYRYDPASGRAWLMEVNGRFWGSLPLASKAGAEFVWLSYAVLGLGREEQAGPVRAGVRAAFLVPEVKRLWRVLFERELIQDPRFRAEPLREMLHFARTNLAPTTRRFLFSWRDPLPALADTAFSVLKRFPGR